MEKEKKMTNKGGAPKDHWEIRYSTSPGYGKTDPMHAFDPKCAKDRPTMHNKVNPTDH